MEVIVPSPAHVDPNASRQAGYSHEGYPWQQGSVSPQAALQHAAAQAAQAAIPVVQPYAMAMPAAHTMQTGYWSGEMPAYGGSPTIHERVIHQVSYYFSNENLSRDEFLRGHMDQREGWLPIQLLASFNRLRSLTTDVHVIAESLRYSPELEVCDGLVRRRHDWHRWLGPQAQVQQLAAGGPTSPTPSSPDSKADATSPLLTPRSSATGFSRDAPPSSDPTGSVLEAGWEGSSGSSPRPQGKQPGQKLQKQQQQLSHPVQPQQPQQQQQQQQPQQPRLPGALLPGGAAPTVDGSTSASGVGASSSARRDTASSRWPTHDNGRPQTGTATAKASPPPAAEASAATGSSLTRGGASSSSSKASSSQAAGTSSSPTAAARGGAKAKVVAVAAVSSSPSAPPKQGGGKERAQPMTAAAAVVSKSAGKRAASAPRAADEDMDLWQPVPPELLCEDSGRSNSGWQQVPPELWVQSPELYEAQLQAQFGGAAPSASANVAEEVWETAQSGRRGGRKEARAGERKDAGGAGAIGLTHLKDSPPLSTAGSGKGEPRSSNQSKWDEGHSDQTTLLNDEDWSSAGSAEEPRPASPDAQSPDTVVGKEGGIVAPMRKRAPPKGKASEKAQSAPSRPRELQDAPPLESRGSAASMLASIDLELVASAASAAAGAASRCAAAQYERALSHTPRMRALVRTHGAEAYAQVGLVLLAVLVLLVLPTSQLPPSLGELSASRWLELPLGLLLGLKVNDVGTQLWSLCTPCPAPGPAPDKAAHSKTS